MSIRDIYATSFDEQRAIDHTSGACEEYRRRVENPKADRTVRKYLQKLARYSLVRIEGASRDRH
ncbi:hypothetical protein [Halomarina ordinaria]|uniref:Uncharacterized protein n=1 Tax=Halomarina ordinaria TaxID=3033939 RepID=A0ABD5UC32_9EURY|nr:hypothetical protein [Halomarina sp. PSRA2]